MSGLMPGESTGMFTYGACLVDWGYVIVRCKPQNFRVSHYGWTSDTVMQMKEKKRRRQKMKEERRRREALEEFITHMEVMFVPRVLHYFDVPTVPDVKLKMEEERRRRQEMEEERRRPPKFFSDWNHLRNGGSVFFSGWKHLQGGGSVMEEIRRRPEEILANMLTEMEEERRRQEMKEDGRRLQKIVEEVLTEMEEERRRLQKAVEESSRQRKMEEERRRRQEILRFMKDLRWRELAAKGRGKNPREKIMRDLVNKLQRRLEEKKETHEERGSRKLNDMSGGDNRDQTDLPNTLEVNRKSNWTADGDWSIGAEEHAQQGKAMETKSPEAHAKDSAKLYGVKENLPMFSPDSTKNQDKKTGLAEHFVGKRNLILAVSGSISRSSEDLHMGRVDVHAGDENLLNADFRKKHGISDIIRSTKICVPEEVFNDPEPRLFVRMRPVGEGKDSWEHCTTPEGEAALSEEQPLYISELLEGCSSFPASATWVLETPKKCTPSSVLEAVLEINLVTFGSMVQAMESNITGGNPLALLSIQVKGEEHKAVTDVQLERTCVATETEQHVNSAEEKYQTEPMEK